MTARDLAAAVRSRGFTPSVRDVGVLVDLLATADAEAEKDVERALSRLGDGVLPELEARARSAKSPLRGRLCRVIGRLAPESEGARAFLLEALADADAKTRRNAIVALGKVSASGVEDALLDAWEREDRVDHRRSLAASLGKIGGARALAKLRAANAHGADDAELARIIGRALLMLERTGSRGEESGIDAERAPEIPTQVVLHCRAGIESILASELAKKFDARVTRPARVMATLTGPMKELFDARTMMSFGFPLPQQWLRDGEDAGDVLVRAMATPEAATIFRTWTRGAIRYRIAWGGGGHRRAVVWRAAQRIGELDASLVNDPTESTWEVTVHQQRRFIDVEVAPRALVDPRFLWRVGDVPAASHPTLAAAIARVAGVESDDVVWDPFVGSGSELVERALAGPYARLIGTDIDPAAVEIAKKNLASAEVPAHKWSVEVGDATTFTPPPPGGVTLIVSNPPMGRRVHRHTQLGQLLDRMIDRAAELLVPGGRMVWLSPIGERTKQRALAAGLRVEFAQDVDMGGFFAQLQRLRKPELRRGPSRPDRL